MGTEVDIDLQWQVLLVTRKLALLLSVLGICIRVIALENKDILGEALPMLVDRLLGTL